MNEEQDLFSFAKFASEIVRIDNRFQFLFRKWLYETSSGETVKDFRDVREIIRIPVPQEIDYPEESAIRMKDILIRPIIWRDANGNKTNRVVVEMPQMNFIL